MPEGAGGATKRNAGRVPPWIVVQSLTTSLFLASRSRLALTRAQYELPDFGCAAMSLEASMFVSTPEGLWAPGEPSGVHAVDAVMTFQLPAALQLQTETDVPGICTYGTTCTS
jgi:hypothetical protein